MKYTIDAKGKALGRVATEVATILMGKNTPAFTKNNVADVSVEIINASHIKVTPGRLRETMHERYSGYPGGFKAVSGEHIIEKKGHAELFRLAVYGMLPANKLRSERMKLLTITA